MHTIKRGGPIVTLIVTCLGTFMVLLDGSIVTLALPSIQASLHAQLVDLQWTIDAYILPFAALLLTAGTLGDRFGRKRLFQTGLVLFLSGSTLCGFAPALNWLIVGRVIQGIGGAALAPGSLSILAAAFPEPRSRAKVIGIWSGVAGIALAAGPVVGGVLIQVANWPMIFFVNVPLGLITLILGGVGLAESRNPQAHHIDTAGLILAIATLTCLIMALIESSSLGWTAPAILALCGATVIFLAAFLLVETRGKDPMLPPGLFGNRSFSIANFATIALGFVILGIVFFLAQFFQTIQGATPLEAGLETLPITMGTFLISPFAGMLTARTSPRFPSILGAVLSAVSLLLLLDLSATSSFISIWWKLAMLGVGIGLMFSPLTVAILAATPVERTGLASSMASTSRQIGSSLGVAVLGALVLQRFSSNITSALTQHGLSSSLSASIANKIASAGAQANQAPVSAHLPIPVAALHQIVGQAFVDALHSSFIVSSIVMLITAALMVALTQKKSGQVAQPQESTISESTQIDVTAAD